MNTQTTTVYFVSETIYRLGNESYPGGITATIGEGHDSIDKAKAALERARQYGGHSELRIERHEITTTVTRVDLGEAAAHAARVAELEKRFGRR